MENTVTRLYESSRLTHDRLASGVHIFTFKESSRQALDEWFVCIDLLWQGYARDKSRILSIVDSSACGTQPLNYAMHLARKMLQKYDYRPITRTAFIDRNPLMVRILDAFLNMLAKNLQVRYFTGSQHDEALTWLLS